MGSVSERTTVHGRVVDGSPLRVLFLSAAGRTRNNEALKKGHRPSVSEPAARMPDFDKGHWACF